MSERPRLLLVPTVTELEWVIRPQLEEWAEVAAFDAPGVGSEPEPEQYGVAAIVERGVAELDLRGWSDVVIVGDEFGTYVAVRIATARRDSVAGLALGHACLSLRRDGERPVINAPVMDAFERLLDTDFRTYARHLTQVTQGAYGEEMADRYLERVPQSVARAYQGWATTEAEEPMEPLLRELETPLLLVKHDGCLGWTDESFDDISSAFPEAMTAKLEVKPSASPEFSALLREFCGARVYA